MAAVDDASSRSATASRKLRADKDMLPLADAAKCRSEADWLVGINGTRAMTAFNSKEGGFYLTTVGRVQTPTLAILVEREDKIRAFTARDYWEVHARFGAKAGEYPGRWFDPEFKKDDDARAQGRAAVGCKAQAAAIAAACQGKTGVATEETKPTTQLSPLLFDLTSLQREANGRFGFPARMTLSLAQALYEKHKVLTYPRTDSRALPEDYLPTVKDTLKALGETDAFAPFARADPEAGLGQAEQAHLRQHQDLGPLRDHPDAADAEASERGGAEALRHGGAALPRGVLSGGGIPADHAHHAVGEHHFKTEGQVLQNARLARGLRPRGRRGERRTCRAIEQNEKVQRASKSPSRRTRPSRRRATRKRRCSPRWKAPASWSRTTSCARRWKPRASARRRRAPRPSRA